jgi:stringent starvation protein B
MTLLKPYLVRAIYDWIVDNHFTPYLLINAETKNAVVPRQYVQDGKIVLNLKPQAVHGLSLGNTQIEFSARFGGNPMHVQVPIAAVMAIYAKENGKGMIFDDENGDGTPPPAAEADSGANKPSRPALRVVK